MKFIFPLALLAAFSLNAKADVPKLPDLSRWNDLSDSERAQAGAFFLFYDMAKDKMIGPGSGVCLNYEQGDGGRPDKISIGIDPGLFETGKVDNQKDLSKTEAIKKNQERLSKILGRLKNYLDAGCEDGDCKSRRKVTVSGYADAQRNTISQDHQIQPIPAGTPISLSEVNNRKQLNFSKNPSNPSVEESIRANTNLATRRALLYANKVKDFTDNITVIANPSPIGEYLAQGKQVPASMGAGNLNAKNFNTDCQARRRAVIDVEFDSKKIDITQGDGTLGLNISVGSKEFLTMTGMGSAVQVMKASISKNTTDPNQIIDSILDQQGITDPTIRQGCKNEGTKEYVKESLKYLTNGGEDFKQLISSTSEKDILTQYKLSTKKKQFDKSQAPLQEMYAQIKTNGYLVGKSELDGQGFSSSVMDCFSAKSSLSAELETNPALKSKLCLSAKDFAKNGSLKLSYNPHAVDAAHPVHHVGCTGCGTGLNFNYDPATKETSTSYVDRFYGNTFIGNPPKVPANHRPYSKDEVNDFISVRDKVRAEIVGLGVKDIKPIWVENLFNDLNGAAYKKTTLEKIKTIREKIQDKESFDKVVGVLDRYFQTPFAKDKQYLQSSINVDKKDKNKKLEEYYENVLSPSINTQKKLSNWNGKENSDVHNRFSFGGLKSPGYQVIPNCRCSDNDVVEKASLVATTSLKSFPYKNEVPMSDPENTCIFVPPVPSSCSYRPNEEGLNTKNKDAPPPKISWLNADGVAMEKAVTEMAGFLDQENKKFGEVECVSTNPIDKAQELLERAACEGPMSLPASELNDCKKASAQ